MSKEAQSEPPEKNPIGKIIIDRDLCIGAGSCSSLASGVFALDEENKAVVLNPNGNDDEAILLAAKSCPVFAISLYTKKNKQLYPEASTTAGGTDL